MFQGMITATPHDVGRQYRLDMEYAYIALIVFTGVMALTNWRFAVYLCLIADVVRDPVRKLSENQPVWVTVAGVVPWMLVMLKAFSQEQPELRAVFQRYPLAARILGLLIVALVPGFLLSCVSYSSGYILAIIGAASYLAPLAGLALGYLLIKNERTMTRFLTVYILLNSVMMIGTPLEFLEMDVPGLGGIRMDWIRYREGYIVDLISGFYRSPDVMGLHAAHIVMFGLILAARSKSTTAIAWLTLVLWGLVCILLCGRRKMIAIPLVFLAAYLVLSYFYGSARRVRTLTSVVLLMAVATGALLASDLGLQWGEYAEYASTTLSESPDRLNDNVLGGLFESIRQSGILGAGLGTGTQGRYYAAVQTGDNARGWQEDGLGRLIIEVGVPGFILFLIAGYNMVVSFRQSLQLVPRESTVRDLQLLLLAVVAGDLASFLVAHQHFSGDPVSALIVTLLGGAVLGAPRAWAIGQVPFENVRETSSLQPSV